MFIISTDLSTSVIFKLIGYAILWLLESKIITGIISSLDCCARFSTNIVFNFELS